MRGTKLAAVCVVAWLGVSPQSRAAPVASDPIPRVAQDVDIEEHLGRRVNGALTFTDSHGHVVRLGDYFDGRRPVVLILTYFRCPMLCGLVLHGAVDAMKGLDGDVYRQVRVLTVSFDPGDTPPEAAKKRENVLATLQNVKREGDWDFVVGAETNIHALADTLGFSFVYDAPSRQFAHPAALFVLTPDGRVSRYLYGVRYDDRDVRLALVEATQGKIGSISDRVLLTCFRYDPSSRKYGPAIAGFMRLGGVAILFAVCLLLSALLWKEHTLRGSKTR